jgi:RNA polymerase sigma-54 factor
MKPALTLRQSQQLALTPQLQQAIRLLQLSTLEVNQEVEHLLAENPMLERDDDEGEQIYSHGDAPAASAEERPDTAEEPDRGSGDEEWAGDEWGESAYSSSGQSEDEGEETHAEVAAESPSLREHLLWQLNMSQLGEADKRIVGLLVDALDENGYLAQPLQEIAELLPEQLEITLDDLETALTQLQNLGVPGVGARDLGECLSLQLKALPEDTPGRDLALRIVSQHLGLLAAHDFAKLKKTLHCDDDALRTAHALIVQLNPKPGAEFGQRVSDYVVPDVIVERHQGNWRARLNSDAMPRLRINQIYASILQQRGEKSAQQLSSQLQEARWFIKNLQQRFETILRVSQAIVERQRHFLEHGEIAMRPLVLREIADQLGLHESTVSRVTTQKFMLTPRGIFELKYFFGSGVSTEAGGTCSATAIRELIKQLVSQEDNLHPLSDSRMSEILAKQGILVARRTVAKYREAMHILPANLRKTI